MTRILRPPLPRPPVPFAHASRGVLVLFGLALVAATAALVPVKGELLGLMAGILGTLALALVIPAPEQHPLLALGWIGLAFALPVSLVLMRPALPEAMALTLGASGLWAVLVSTARRLPKG